MGAIVGLLLVIGLAWQAGAQVQLPIDADPLSSFADGADGPKHAIIVSEKGVPSGEGGRRIGVTDVNGTSYECYVAEASPSRTKVAETETAGSELVVHSPEQLLRPLKGWCAYRVEDWWTYEVCYERHVRQYHKESTAILSEYLLGAFDAGSTDVNVVREQGSDVARRDAYVSQLYSRGDVCDITGRPRQAEVRYVCGPTTDDVVSSVQEAASCSYVLTVLTPRLCKHSAFRSAPPVLAAIKCYEVDQPADGQAKSGSHAQPTCSGDVCATADESETA